MLISSAEGIEQGAVIGSDDRVGIILQRIIQLGIDAVEHLQVALAVTGVVVQGGTQGDGAGTPEVGADVTEGYYGRHPGHPDFIRGLVHLPGFVKCDQAHEQNQDAQQGEHACSANADLQIP
ncbi:hypothetical protein D3C80_1094740 [compost metagenome]